MTGWLRSLKISPRWASRLPGTSLHFGPPRRLGWIRQDVPRLGGQVWTVDNRRLVPHPNPTWYGPPVQLLNFEWPSTSAPGSVFELPEARLLGQDASVVGTDDTMLIDTSFWGWSKPYSPHEHPIYRRKKSPPLTRIKGRVLSLATDFGLGSFGHLLHDGVSRLDLIQKAGFDLNQFDWLYLPRPAGPSVHDLESVLGYPSERILNWQAGRDLIVDSLTATSYPCEPGFISVEGAELIRDRAQTRWGGGPRLRVYLTRKGYRRTLSNEAEIAPLLAAHNFITVDPARDRDVLATCANAEIILGVDGSNMANLAFAPAGARVLLLMPPVGPPVPYNSTLAVSGGRKLHIAVGEETTDPANPYSGNFRLPPERLKQALAQIL